MPDYIELFMWGFQSHFRHAVVSTVEAALDELGLRVEVEVFLVGFLDEGPGHQICIEPEDGPLLPRDFETTSRRASEIYTADPESQILHSERRYHELRQRGVRDHAWGEAIAEILEMKLELSFSVAMPTTVAGYRVFTAIGLPKGLTDEIPSLMTRKTPDDERIVVTRSLLESAVAELRRQISRALHEPDAGSGIGSFAQPEDVARAAGESLTVDAAYRADSGMPAHSFFDAMNELATTRYEKRAGLGRLILASPTSSAIDRVLLLDRVVPMRETRTIRKLLEMSSGDGAALLTNGSEAYGLGTINSTYDGASESVFEIIVSGPGSWDLRHLGIPLMSVAYGAPRLPAERLSRTMFETTADRLFEAVGGCDSKRLWELAMAAADAEHGTMLVVSAEAQAEAVRLQAQALSVHPSQIDAGLVRQVTRIDGAVLVDPTGALMAVGVILDGTATSEGDRARGARFNSAVRYLASASKPTLIVLVSEDGMLDLLPRLRPRRKRADLSAMLDQLRIAAALDPVDGERVLQSLQSREGRIVLPLAGTV